MLAKLDVYVDKRHVDRLLANAAVALSPISFATFLKARVEPYLSQRARERFADEGDSASGPWAALAKSTQNIRSSLGYGAEHPINKRTGELEDYITQSSASIAAVVDGALLNQPGTEPQGELRHKVEVAQRGEGAAPPRPVVAADTLDLETILVGLGQHIEAVCLSGKLF